MGLAAPRHLPDVEAPASREGGGNQLLDADWGRDYDFRNFRACPRVLPDDDPALSQFLRSQ